MEPSLNLDSRAATRHLGRAIAVQLRSLPRL